MINKVILIGNLGRDAEVRTLENGAMVARITVATNENYRDKNNEWQTQTEWHDVVLWRSLAERAEQNFKKGNLVYIEGKLTHRKWKDKDGNDRYTTEVIASVARSLERKEGGGGGRGGYSDNFPTATDEPGFARQAERISPEVTQMEDDDLPF